MVVSEVTGVIVADNTTLVFLSKSGVDNTVGLGV